VQLQVVHGYAAPEAERTYLRARALCEQVQDEPSLFLVLWGLWMYYEVGSQLRKSLELAVRLFTIAQNAEDQARFVQAHMAMAVASFSKGELAATREHTERGIAIYDPKQHGGHSHIFGQDPLAVCRAFGAVALWLLGFPDQAVESSRKAVAYGEELGHPTTHALALYFATMVGQYCRDAPAVQRYADATMAIGVEHKLSLWQAIGRIMGGWAQVEQGARERGIAQLRQGLTEFAATGAETHRTYFLGLLVDALAKEGKIDEAMSVIAEALVMLDGNGTLFHAPEIHRLRGECLLRQESTEVATREAEACFRDAIAIARRQQAKSLELRAAMSLSRLYRDGNRIGEARALLAETYGWFTEGFGTKDLQEAKALLDELA
jgi:predicted ATPase